MTVSVLQQLLRATWESPVFGDSFGVLGSRQAGVVARQIETLAEGCAAELGAYIRAALPALSPSEVQTIVNQIIPKTVSFCPALAAGELDDMVRLQALAVAISLMYWGDQTMDRGDQAMPYAIGLLGDHRAAVPRELRAAVRRRFVALQGIQAKVAQFAMPTDRALVLACFEEQVLLNEARLHQLSQEYEQASDQAAFLATHGEAIANMMVIDAGFPSVSSSLYAVYRHHDSSLPPLASVYAEPSLVRLLQICNAVVRVADDVGDYETDAGQHPEWGVFGINICNQPHPVLLKAFLALAHMPPGPKTEELHQQLADFLAHPENGEYIVQAFLVHIKKEIAALPAGVRHKFSLYITLCKRVLEIGYVNRQGDIALAQK